MVEFIDFEEYKTTGGEMDQETFEEAQSAVFPDYQKTLGEAFNEIDSLDMGLPDMSQIEAYMGISFANPDKPVIWKLTESYNVLGRTKIRIKRP